MADRVVIRCTSLGLRLRLPVWPTDSTHTPSGLVVASLDRDGRAPLDVVTARTTAERSLGFTLRNEDYYATVQPLIAELERLVLAEAPVQLLMGDFDTGLWRLEAPQITELARADDGTPSVVDVSLVLKRASDAIVKVGPVKRVRGRGKGMAS